MVRGTRWSSGPAIDLGARPNRDGGDDHALGAKSERQRVTPLVKAWLSRRRVQGGPVAQAGVGGFVGWTVGSLSKRVIEGRLRISITRLA